LDILSIRWLVGPAYWKTPHGFIQWIGNAQGRWGSSQGPSANQSAAFIVHGTSNANGETTAEVENVRWQCDWPQ